MWYLRSQTDHPELCINVVMPVTFGKMRRYYLLSKRKSLCMSDFLLRSFTRKLSFKASVRADFIHQLVSSHIQVPVVSWWYYFLTVLHCLWHLQSFCSPLLLWCLWFCPLGGGNMIEMFHLELEILQFHVHYTLTNCGFCVNHHLLQKEASLRRFEVYTNLQV